jgi:hypothetical protein
MATKTQIGSVTVDAFQWLGGTIAGTSLPIWAKKLYLHTPGDGSLHVPTARGTFRALSTDWVMQTTTGDILIMSNVHFTAYYA